MQTGDFDLAIRHFDEILAELPGEPVTLTSKGHAFKTKGDYEAAVAAYRDATLSRSRYGEAYYSLANLKVYNFSDDEIRNLHEQESNPNLSHIDRIYFCFALGKAYEDKKDFETAFTYYERGNQLKKAQSRYSAEQMSEELRAQRDVCTETLFRERQGQGHDAPDPIFIVGLPRAGSTLLEQVLSSTGRLNCPISCRCHSDCAGAAVSVRHGATRTISPNSPPRSSEISAGSSSMTREFTGSAPRFSSTRCRTTSGTSG